MKSRADVIQMSKLKPGTVEKYSSNICLSLQIGKIEWLDKSTRKKGFECLFNLFKKYYLHHVFPMWTPRTNLYATNPGRCAEAVLIGCVPSGWYHVGDISSRMIPLGWDRNSDPSCNTRLKACMQTET